MNLRRTCGCGRVRRRSSVYVRLPSVIYVEYLTVLQQYIYDRRVGALDRFSNMAPLCKAIKASLVRRTDSEGVFQGEIDPEWAYG